MLGLSRQRAQRLKKADTFLDDVINAWLTGVDDVGMKGGATWKKLVEALKNPKLGQSGRANRIATEKGV